MQTQHAPMLLHDRPTDSAQSQPRSRVIRTTPPRHMFGAFAVATAALVATGGYVHLCLYRHGYRTIPKIGVGFLLQVAASAVVAVALLIGPHRIARVAHVTDRLAGTLAGLAAAAVATGTLVAFALTRTPEGLFNFQERGLQPSPQALLALVAEVGVLVVVGAWLAADQVIRRRLRRIPAPPA